MLEQGDGIAELLSFTFAQSLYCFGERFDATLAPFPHKADTFGCGFEADAAAVFGGVAADKTGAVQAGDDAAHGWRAHLFRVGKFAKRSGTAEHEDGQGGKLGGADAAFAIAYAKSSEQVNGSGMKLISSVCRCSGR